ncbi:MAG: FadR family transcriptional regulator [Lentisphaeria bacterium]|nr:FadR family transcriptional regulator [Lentisphaeria bacterium]
MLATIKQASLTDVVEERIYNYLRENDFRPGDSFHGEKELSEMLKISRPVVREALSRLRMLGLLESRKRRGIVVGRPTIFETLSKMIDPKFLSEEEQRDFFNLRLTIELGLADMLVANISAGDIAELEKIVGEEECDPTDYERYLDCDYRFHSRIYQATKCHSLSSFQKLLLQFFNDSETRRKNASESFPRRFEDPEQVSHRDLLEAIRTLDPDRIQTAMRRHLKIHYERMKQN